MYSGVPTDLRSECDSLSTSSTTGNRHQSKDTKDLQNEGRATYEAVKDLIGQAKSLLDQRQKHESDELVKLQRALKEQKKYKQMFEEDNALTPESRELLINKVTKRKRRLHQKIFEI